MVTTIIPCHYFTLNRVLLLSRNQGNRTIILHFMRALVPLRDLGNRQLFQLNFVPWCNYVTIKFVSLFNPRSMVWCHDVNIKIVTPFYSYSVPWCRHMI